MLVDEAHRTTGGDLGNYLMGALPNATFIGFTGTPIDRTAHGRGTFKTFGADDPQGYLDKYSIQESIEDGTTVPLHYQLAPNDLIADREAMEKDFWAAAELEGVADVEEPRAGSRRHPPICSKTASGWIKLPASWLNISRNMSNRWAVKPSSWRWIARPVASTKKPSIATCRLKPAPWL